MSHGRRAAMIAADHPRLSIVRQCALVRIARSSHYYVGQGETPQNRQLMRLIDAQYLLTPWYGSRQMARHLRRQGYRIGRKRARRLMRLMGLSAIYRKPRTSQPHPDHRIYPYLLRKVRIDRPNQVWCADVTYIPMQHGFQYLVAIMDWATRTVLAWRLSNTLDSDFCTEALEEALARYGTPEIFNTDQGGQFTSTDFTEILKRARVQISMDGKGRWMDNVFIERLWRSLKYDCVYLHDFQDGPQARQIIGAWLRYYNEERPHSTHADDRTPMEVYARRRAA
jgi:putative transposase